MALFTAAHRPLAVPERTAGQLHLRTEYAEGPHTIENPGSSRQVHSLRRMSTLNPPRFAYPNFDAATRSPGLIVRGVEYRTNRLLEATNLR